MFTDQFTAFLLTAFRLFSKHRSAGSLHYCRMDWRHMSEVLAADLVYSEMMNLCIWVKSNGGMGSFYRSQHELILYSRMAPLNIATMCSLASLVEI